MKHRSELRIVFDMLKLLEDGDPHFVSNIIKNVGLHHTVEDKYLKLLNDNQLVSVTGTTIEDMMIIGWKGKQYLEAYRELLRLMGERE